MFFLLCIHVYMFLCMWVHVCVCTCGGQRLMLNVSLNYSPPCFWDRVSHCTWNWLTRVDWLPSPRNPCLCLSKTVIPSTHHHIWLLGGAGEPNLGPHAWVANALSAGQSPWPYLCFLCLEYSFQHLARSSIYGWAIIYLITTLVDPVTHWISLWCWGLAPGSHTG